MENVTALYHDKVNLTQESVQITEFIDDIAQAYAWADIVICRSGALTVCELAAVGTPAIFVPFQHKDKQQYLNAKYLADVGAAYIVEQHELDAEKIAQLLKNVDKEKLLEMAEKAKNMSTPLSTQRVAEVIMDTVKT